MSRRKVCIVTTSRADLSPLLPVMRAVDAHPDLEPRIAVTGMHLLPEHARGRADLSDAGFAADVEIASIPQRELASGDLMTHTVATGLSGISAYLSTNRPDIVVVLGDRYDMFPAALAAALSGVPLAHIHGGEVTEGAIDDSIRHAVSKLAHLHFVAAEEFATRLKWMGEENWRITVCGAPGLDNILSAVVLEPNELAEKIGLPAAVPYSLLTVHPETLSTLSPLDQVGMLIDAAEQVDGWIVITRPNADAGGNQMAEALAGLAGRRAETVLMETAGPEVYPNLLRHAKCVVGNSSSGVIEAGVFGTPVVNVGDRQKGRPTGENVTHAPWSTASILDAWRRAATGRATTSGGADHPYGSGGAAKRIAERLADVTLGHKLIRKQFDDSARQVVS